ncbi:MAG TPA: hypothetical protein VGN52_04155 [Burkholderiales bacterium]|jgi:hypothetical protein
MKPFPSPPAPRIAALAGACLAALLAGCNSLPVSHGATLARVTGVYVEVAPGVHSERSGRPAEAGKPLVAEVRVPGLDGAPAKIAMVRVGNMEVAPGDSVEVNLGERGMLTGVRPAAAYIVRIDTPADTAIARNTAPMPHHPLPGFLRGVHAPVLAEPMPKLSLSDTLTLAARP